MVLVAWKDANVYIDTSAYSPKYYPPELIQFAKTTGRNKVMFGTNFPQLQWKDCVQNVAKHLTGDATMAFREGTLREFMGGNARRVLKLDYSKDDSPRASL